jgi:hypothetical protein
MSVNSRPKPDARKSLALLWGILAYAFIDTGAAGARDSVELLHVGEPDQMSAEQIVTLPESRHDNSALELKYDNSSWFWLKKSSWKAYLAITILENGRVGNIEVAVPSGSMEFDSAIVVQAESAISYADWRFTPGIVRGKPKAMQILMPVSVSSGKEGALNEKNRLLAPLVSEWERSRQAQIDEWRMKALDEQSRELAERRAIYPREAPYRLLPSQQISDSEMAARLFQAFNLHTHCGRSVVQKGELSGWHEYRDVKVLASADKLSDIDRLNGYEWKGTIEMSYPLYRYRGKSSVAWSDWGKGSSRLGRLEKKKGNWSISYTNISLGISSDTPVYIRCADMPTDK